MEITFQINYRTMYGETLCVIESAPLPSGWSEEHPLELSCHGQDFWTKTVTVSDFVGSLVYKYAIRRQNGEYHYEECEPRHIVFRSDDKHVVVRDFWQVEDYERVFRTRAFTSSLFARKSVVLTQRQGVDVRFSIEVPQILPHQGVAVMGNVAELGNWKANDMLRLDDSAFPLWQGGIDVADAGIIEYKYCIYDLDSGQIVDLEWGENRYIWDIQKGVHIIQNDRGFRRTQPRWKGAGVAIPVFSLRTDEGFGIGEFSDIMKLADWAVKTGQKMIQTLPINDTTITHTNRDSYPYNAVSVFALNPIYINIPRMGRLSPTLLKRYEKTLKEFNAKRIADYQCVYDEKMKYFKALYQADKTFMDNEEYQLFYHKNQSWLEPYTEFMHKRDKQPAGFYAYLQYHADKQLSEAVRYAHSLGVAIKGDIPIGISPDSVEASSTPELFNLSASAGAPPDDFSISGQNWGFPTYNWDEMSKDNYDWWRKRFQKMQDYFDAYRIDHILGFFRIWQMRKSDVWGLCGHFSPALPYSMNDLRNMGVTLDAKRLTEPYIREHIIEDIFGKKASYVRKTFLRSDGHGGYTFKDAYDTQVKVQAYCVEENIDSKILDGLLLLHCEMLFVRDQRHPEMLHPRISLHQSYSFRDLEEGQRHVIMDIYNDYFFHRHNAFWRQSAMNKLPTLIHSTNMLCCGEDLGMVPACVPDVMHELKILSLEIQRMPKDSSRMFAHPGDAPYLSVCTTGTHDTSPLRAWWEEDASQTQQYYNDQMGMDGKAPKVMTEQIAETILTQHMHSPAMWVILPLQDWLAIDNSVRLADPFGERINIPANPHHFWNYRMHIRLEDLISNDHLNAKIRKLTNIRL